MTDGEKIRALEARVRSLEETIDRLMTVLRVLTDAIRVR